jgi:hypothetical protein
VISDSLAVKESWVMTVSVTGLLGEQAVRSMIGSRKTINRKRFIGNTFTSRMT